MSWYYIYIDDPQTMMLREAEFAQAMQNLGLAALGSDAAIYVFLDLHNGSYHYYFTPKAAAVALMFGAKPWNMPSRDAVGSFAVGDPSLFQRLYP